MEIQHDTGVLLSVTTLKRLWGKLKYSSLPAMVTLNTLARFTGSCDWNAFKQKINQDSSCKSPLPDQRNQRKTSKYRYWLIAPVLLGIVASAIFFYPASREDSYPGSYKFSSNKILTAGLPNSVVFNYTVPKSGKAPVFIAQSWDETRKIEVSRLGHTFSAIYYEPGHYSARLMVGDEVVKEHELLIASKGWMAMTEIDSGTRIYFKQKEIIEY